MKVSFLNESGAVEQREVSETVSEYLDAIRVAQDALDDVVGSAVDAMAEIFGKVKLPKKCDARTAEQKLREDDAMATLRGLLYPTSSRWQEYVAAVEARDKLPKGKRKDQQLEVQSIRSVMKGRVEYLATLSLRAYVADVLGLEYGSGKKRTEEQRLQTLLKLVDNLTKGKNERVKAIASAMKDAATQAAQAWDIKAKKGAKTPTLDAFGGMKKPRIRKPSGKRAPHMTPAPAEVPTEAPAQ